MISIYIFIVQYQLMEVEGSKDVVVSVQLHVYAWVLVEIVSYVYTTVLVVSLNKPIWPTPPGRGEQYDDLSYLFVSTSLWGAA
jgi:hypothetical protein